MVTVISIEKVKDLIDSKGDYVLIDVREPDELDNGALPTSHNIPLNEIPDAFEMDATEFKAKYGFAKPTKKDNLIFYCRSGGRSENATAHAESKGYNAKNFQGSIWQWAEIDETVKRYGPAPY